MDSKLGGKLDSLFVIDASGHRSVFIDKDASFL